MTELFRPNSYFSLVGFEKSLSPLLKADPRNVK